MNKIKSLIIASLICSIAGPAYTQEPQKNANLIRRQYNAFASDAKKIRKCYFSKSKCSDQEKKEARKALARLSAKGAALIATLVGVSLIGKVAVPKALETLKRQALKREIKDAGATNLEISFHFFLEHWEITGEINSQPKMNKIIDLVKNYNIGSSKKMSFISLLLNDKRHEFLWNNEKQTFERPIDKDFWTEETTGETSIKEEPTESESLTPQETLTDAVDAIGTDTHLFLHRNSGNYTLATHLDDRSEDNVNAITALVKEYNKNNKNPRKNIQKISFTSEGREVAYLFLIVE